ncbi:MAG: phage minor head protein [Muribaculaceae bacterium]
MSNAINDGAHAPNRGFLTQLGHSADIFSAFKTHSQQRELGNLLTNDKGKLRSFSDFQKASTPIIGKYNRNWLRTEYNTAVRRSSIAANWQQYEAEKDVMPCLEWIESTSPNPGADHSVFWGTIQPVDSSFWNEHAPGDRWNCQCSLEQTDKDPTIAPKADSASIPQPGLDNNPGRDGKLFNESHPYYPKSCSACPFSGNKLMALMHDLTDDRDCHNCKYVDKAIASGDIEKRKKEYNAITGNVEKTFFDKQSGGYVVTDKDRIESGNRNKQELAKYEKEKNMCINYAKAGYAIRHLGEVSGVSSSDVLCNRVKADLKSTGSHNNILKYAKKAIREQGAKMVLFEFEKMSVQIKTEINKVSKLGIHGMYYIIGREKEIMNF